MALGRYKVPRPFQDEDKWFKYFTKTQLLFLGTGICLAVPAFKASWGAPWFLQIPLLVYSIAVIGFFGIVGAFKMPDDKYLWGGGTPLYTLLIRIVLKKLGYSRKIYTKFYVVDRGRN